MAAEQLLRSDLDVHQREVFKVFRLTDLKQEQLDAPSSASFNCGCLKQGKSGIGAYLKQHLPLLNREENPGKQPKELEGIIAYFCRYNRANGSFMDGLLRRRVSEGLVFAGAEKPIVTNAEYRQLKKQTLAEVSTDAIPRKVIIAPNATCAA